MPERDPRVISATGPLEIAPGESMMNRAFALLTVLLGLGLPVQAEETAGKVRCLVVGLDDYATSPLDGCVADATAMKSFLGRHFGPERTSVKAILDPRKSPQTVSAQSVLDGIKQIAGMSKSEDYFVFYYSGHGSSDGSLALPNGTISPKALAIALSSVRAKLVTVILDSCHAGHHCAEIDTAFKNRSFVAVLAVKGDQTAKTCAFADGEVCPTSSAKGSVFTRWLLLAMHDKKNDRNGDGLVSWREALQKAKASWNAAEEYRLLLRDAQSREPDESLEMEPVFKQRVLD